jgi:hypothetical protein
MTRARRRLTAALTVALTMAAIGLLGGCGLPGRTDPKYVGPAPTARPAPERITQPLTPGGTNDLSVLVSRYLATSVGGNDQPDAVSETQARMKTFMTEQRRVQWQPMPLLSVLVVKVAEVKAAVQGRDPGTSSLSVTFTPLYTLSRSGQLTEPQLPPKWTNTFEFQGEQVGDQLLLSAVPDGMVLSTEGLRDWYEPQAVYFWEKDVNDPKLVPDLRYMPKVLSATKRVSEVTRWLAEGPSSWLDAVVEKLPSEIETKDNPSLDAGGVVVNLSSKARGRTTEDLRKVASQIRWSLAGHPPVTLTIENRKDAGYGSDGYDSDNAAVVPGGLDQEKFIVLDGEARPADVSSGITPLFAPGESNKKVVSAAINRTRSKAALVRTVNGQQRLFVSAADATATSPPKYVETSVAGTYLSRPAWVGRPLQRFLIADGSQLYAVTPPANPGDPATVDVVLGPGDTGTSGNAGITAFAVSPDGRRIALIVGNKTRVATLRVENGKLRLGASKPVENSLGANRAVGWFTETSLAIGGQANPLLPKESWYWLIATSIDGTGEILLPVNGPEKMGPFDITQMSVRTNDPLGPSPQPFIMFESNGVGQVVYNDRPGAIPTTQASPSPSTSASPSTPPLPKSPFYAD